MPPHAARILIAVAASAAVHLLIMFGVRPVTLGHSSRVVLQARLEPGAPGASGPDTPQASPINAATPVGKETVPNPPQQEEVVSSGGFIPLPLVEPNRYYTAGEVDVRASPLAEPSFIYPEEAARLGISGKVVLRVLINENGEIDDLSAVEAIPPGYFEEAALQGMQVIKFSPAQKSGRNVKSQKKIEVSFDYAPLLSRR